MRTFVPFITLTWLLVAPGAVLAETHRLIPQRFYNTFSAAHPPALRIKPGDRVITKTIDAAGADWILARCGLVIDHDFRFDDECPRKAHAFFLAF